MDKLTQEGQINLAISLLCLIILIVVDLVGIFLVTDSLLQFFTIAFGSFIPAYTIAGIWENNFGKWYLKTKQEFKKIYYVK